jgi:antitoxin component of RelBE/YafQ-DinJ toxin-antitoxin module
MIHLKTNKELKQKAEKLADKLGLTLTGLLNLSIGQLVNSSELVVDLEPKLSPRIIERLLHLKQEADAGKNLSPTFTDPKKALRWLHS